MCKKNPHKQQPYTQLSCCSQFTYLFGHIDRDCWQHHPLNCLEQPPQVHRISRWILQLQHLKMGVSQYLFRHMFIRLKDCLDFDRNI